MFGELIEAVLDEVVSKGKKADRQRAVLKARIGATDKSLSEPERFRAAKEFARRYDKEMKAPRYGSGDPLEKSPGYVKRAAKRRKDVGFSDVPYSMRARLARLRGQKPKFPK